MLFTAGARVTAESKAKIQKLQCEELLLQESYVEHKAILSRALPSPE